MIQSPILYAAAAAAIVVLPFVIAALVRRAIRARRTRRTLTLVYDWERRAWVPVGKEPTAV